MLKEYYFGNFLKTQKDRLKFIFLKNRHKRCHFLNNRNFPEMYFFRGRKIGIPFDL